MSHPKGCHAKQLTLQPKHVAIVAAHMEQWRIPNRSLSIAPMARVGHSEDARSRPQA